MCTVVTSDKWTRAKEDITVFKALTYNDRESCRSKKDELRKYMTPYQYKRVDVPSVMRASTKRDSLYLGHKLLETWPFHKYQYSQVSGYDYDAWRVYDGAIHSYACTTVGLRNMVSLHEANDYHIIVRCHIPKGCLYLPGCDGAVISKTLVLDEVVADNTTLDKSLLNVVDWYREFCKSDFYLNVVCGPKKQED